MSKTSALKFPLPQVKPVLTNKALRPRIVLNWTLS